MINQTQRNVLLGIARMLEVAPDFRIGQLLANCLPLAETGRGLYDIEDAELEGLLWPMIREFEERGQPTLEEQLMLAKSA